MSDQKRAIVLYLHVHQPYRIRHYTIFDSGTDNNYFHAHYDERTSNERIVHKVPEQSDLPTHQKLLELLNRHTEFKVS